jgi:hypothetical protein
VLQLLMILVLELLELDLVAAAIELQIFLVRPAGSILGPYLEQLEQLSH